MAVIPMGQHAQANVVPRADVSRVDLSATRAAGSGAQAIAEGLGDAATAVGNVAHRQLQEQRQEAENLARAKAANALAERQLLAQAAVDNVADQLRRGGDYTKAASMFDEAMGKLTPPQIDGMDPALLEHYQGGLRQADMAGRLRIDNLVVAARRDDGQRQYGTLLDNLGKLAGLPGANIDDLNAKAEAFLPLAREFGMDMSQAEKSLQDWKDKNWTNQALQRFNMGHDDPAALAALQKDLTDPEGAYATRLDADRRNAVALQVGNRIDTLQAKAERAKDKLEGVAERTLATMDEQFASGIPPTAEQWAAWSGVFKDATPELRAEYSARLDDEREIQQLLRKPIDAQLTEMQQRQQALYTQGGDKRARANFTRLKGAVDANVKLLSEQPLQFAQARLGEEVQPIDLQALADPARAGAIGAELQRRAVLVGDLRKRYGGKVQNKLLLPQEAAAISTILDKSPADRKVGLFGQLRQLTGSDSSYIAVMQQIAKDSPVASFGGLLHMRNPKAAELVMIGEGILNRTKGDSATDGNFKAVKLPPQADFDAAMADAVGNAFRGDRADAYAVAMQAVRAGYAGASAKDGDVSGEIDDKRLGNIIKAVIGETVDFNGKGDVFVPYGAEPDEFEDQIEAAWQAQRTSLRAGTPDDLSLYGLQSVGPGRYYVTAGRSYVLDANGNPFVLEVGR